jgi:RNA polymerase sigma-70 factor (ECF subfamily)
MQAPPELSDAEQIRLVLDGNDEAFRDLVRPYRRGLYLKALSIVRNEADAEVRSIFGSSIMATQTTTSGSPS